MDYYGISREITGPIVFIKDGYAYVKDCFNQRGYNAQVFIDVFEFNTELRRYDPYFSGELMMKSVDMDRVSISVLATPSGVASLLKDKGDNKVNLETGFSLDGFFVFDVPLVNVTRRPMTIDRRMESTWDGSANTYGLTNGQKLQLGPGTITADELPGFVKERATIGSSEVFPILNCEEAGTYTFDVDFIIGVGSDNLVWKYRKNDDTPVTVSKTYTAFYQRVTCVDQVTLQKGDKLYFYADVTANVTATLPFVSGRPAGVTDKYNVRAATSFSTFPPFGLMAYEAMNQTIKLVTNERTDLVSMALGRTDLGYAADGPAALNFVTTGAGLAGRNVALNVSFAELYESMRNLYHLGMDIIEDGYGRTQVVIEGFDYFFSGRVGWQITGVSNLRKRVAQELIYSEVKVGFDKYESNLPGAQEDPNTEVTYIVPGRFVNKTLDIRSKIAGSPYLIEEKAREWNQPNKKTTADQTLFLLNMRRQGLGFETARNEAFTEASGIANVATMYNLDIHPARVIQRWSSHISPCFYRNAGLLRWASAESSSVLRTQKSGEMIPAIEGESLADTALLRPKWLPEIYEFDCKLTAAQDRQLLARKYDIIQVQDEDNTLYGYLLERTRKENNEASFTLIRANYNG
jgi:hypothetical protein